MSKEVLNYLAQLITDKESVMMIATYAELPVSRIDFSGSSKSRWYKVITEAKKHKNGILKIIQAALDEYKGDDFLKEELSKLTSNSQSTNSNTNNKPTANSNADSNSGIDKSALKELLGRNKIADVLTRLKKHIPQMDSDQQNELIGLESRFTALAKDIRLGTNSFFERNLQKNTLTMSLLEFIDSIES